MSPGLERRRAQTGRVSIVIVTWNSRRHIGSCLSSVLASSNCGDLEPIVIDNDSTDGTADLVATGFPEVALIRNRSNVGFPAAVNAGLRVSTGEHVLLLNPDTELDPDCIQTCLRAFLDPSVGMVGCKLIYPSGEVQLECACSYPSLWDPLIEAPYLHMLLPRSRFAGRLRMSYWDHMSRRTVPRISGAFMLIRGAVIDRVGPLSEKFFMYYEDLDYCARVREARYEILFEAQAKAVHYSGKSREQSLLPLDDLSAEIKYVYFRDHRGALAAEIYRCLTFLQSICRVCIAATIQVLARRGSQVRSRPVGRVRTHWGRLLWSLGRRPSLLMSGPARSSGRIDEPAVAIGRVAGD